MITNVCKLYEVFKTHNNIGGFPDGKEEIFFNYKKYIIN